jgi:hypothetical protein
MIHVMRTLVCLLLCMIGCGAGRSDDQVIAAFRQMEKAEQTGDVNAWVGLWSRESKPDAHYTMSKVFVQGDEAALLGQSGKEQFLAMRFVREDGRWKIKDMVSGNVAFHADSVYAMVPPTGGAFERAGAPWQNVAKAFDAAEAAKQGWQVRAAYDESFLYVRIETAASLPAPGSTVETPPSGWPVMKVGVSGVGEFVLHAGANIGDQPTFDEHGRANSHRHFVAYGLMLERGDETIFNTSADLHPSPLVQAGEHFFDVRVPLRTMGIADASHTKITVGDAQWPKTAIFSVEAQQFR